MIERNVHKTADMQKYCTINIYTVFVLEKTKKYVVLMPIEEKPNVMGVS